MTHQYRVNVQRSYTYTQEEINSLYTTVMNVQSSYTCTQEINSFYTTVMFVLT